jgi:hypothetical protein
MSRRFDVGAVGVFALLTAVGTLLAASCTMDFGTFAFSDTATAGGGGGTTTPTGTGTGTGTGTSTGTGGTSVGGGGSGPVGGGGSTATGGSGGNPTCDFTAPDTCDSAEELQSVRGDSHNDRRSANGIGSKWFQIEVTEPAGPNNPMSYTVTLTSPASTSYELFVYPSALDASGPDCGATEVAGQGDPQVVTDNWTDSTVGFDNDDRWLSIEIRYASGDACGPGDEWSLEVAGNTQ